MIKVSGVHKSYGNLEVLRGIDLEIKAREIVSIVGPSGAGKTTLLQIIGSLDKPDAGKVLYDNTDIYSMDDNRCLSSHFWKMLHYRP